MNGQLMGSGSIRITRRGVVMGMVAGLLWRPAGAAPDRGYWEGVVRDAAARHGVDPDWLASTCRCESGFDPQAYNPRTGDSGLMQFNPNTYAWWGGTDIWDGHEQAEIAAAAFARGDASHWCCSGMWEGGPCQ